MRTKQMSLFEDQRLTLDSAIDLSLASLNAYGNSYEHWSIAYSGGKDSSATVTFVAWAIEQGLVDPPKSLTILYVDTRMELPPLYETAMHLLDNLRGNGFATQVVLPSMDDRFFVYMFGRGVPPPKNRFRWCTPQLKVEPMHVALTDLRQQTNKKILMLTGVRLGESKARDQRIALSCSKDSGECGQGWFQIAATNEAVADTLAPLVHWRLCHIYDWLYFEQGRHGYDVSAIAVVYGDGDVRTGCAGCNLIDRDVTLERLVKHPEWSHLSPLLELKLLYRELIKPKWRKRKSKPEVRKGKYSKNVQRLGPLTMEARQYGLKKVLDIQVRSRVDLINPNEEARIRELWDLNTWPNGWDGNEVVGSKPINAMGLTSDGKITVQPLLVR